MPRRDLLMLAQTYKSAQHEIGGWYVSEKLDGVRCFWDGGISRGCNTVDVPWAGIINPKTGQRKTRIKPVATGLWSRYGNPIIAPDWFLNTLPCCPLDGELWAGRGNFQKVLSIARKNVPVGNGEEWRDVSYSIFSTPNFQAFCEDGVIKNPNQHTIIDKNRIRKWTKTITPIEDWKTLSTTPGLPTFSTELSMLVEWVDTASDTVCVVPQTKLPEDNDQASLIVYDKMVSVVGAGGEGLVLRDPKGTWIPNRVDTILKVKNTLDDEATVVGYTSGRKTHLGSKCLGMIGALITDYKGNRLEIAGMTNEEREFDQTDMGKFAIDFPGIDMPEWAQGKVYKKGDVVTFTYRELSDRGIPKDARVLRKRQDG